MHCSTYVFCIVAKNILVVASRGLVVFSVWHVIKFAFFSCKRVKTKKRAKRERAKDQAAKHLEQNDSFRPLYFALYTLVTWSISHSFDLQCRCMSFAGNMFAAVVPCFTF